MKCVETPKACLELAITRSWHVRPENSNWDITIAMLGLQIFAGDATYPFGCTDNVEEAVGGVHVNHRYEGKGVHLSL